MYVNFWLQLYIVTDIIFKKNNNKKEKKLSEIIDISVLIHLHASTFLLCHS